MRHRLGEFGGMFFTRTGRVFAHIFFWYGMVAVAYTLFATWTALDKYPELPKHPEAMAAQSKWISREVGEGMTLAFMGLALGVLCEINSKRNKPDKQA